MNTTSSTLGGIIHTYQKYDPVAFPSPAGEQPDLAGAAMEHMLYYGNTRRLTDEELANAVHLDPSQIAGLGPSLEAVKQTLQERKQKILETYETEKAQDRADREFKDRARAVKPPDKLKKRFDEAVKEEQLYELENLFYAAGNDRSPFAGEIVKLADLLGRKYQVDELAANYDFEGREKMTVDKALEVKEELEQIDKLLEQIAEAMKSAKVGLIDMEALSEFTDLAQMDDLKAMMERVNEYIKNQAEQQGLQKDSKGFQITPKAYRLFQNRLLKEIFSQLQESRTGKHEAVVGDGATEIERTKPYEFGDAVSQMDIPQSMINTMLRTAGSDDAPSADKPRVVMKMEDIVIHRTRNTPKCATCLLLDMSGSMRHDGLYVNVKKMGLALDGLIRKEYPGDYLQFIEMATFAKPRHVSEVPALMYKPVTIYDPWVELHIDMADPDITEMQVPPHFTNIQHAMQLGRRMLCNQATPNKQMFLVTDGLPTAHFEGSVLHMLYPPNVRTEAATMREALLCAKEGITINIFLLNNWNQTREDVKFAYRMAEVTKGRVIFTAGKELDRFVVWDYIKHRKMIVS